MEGRPKLILKGAGLGAAETDLLRVELHNILNRLNFLDRYASGSKYLGRMRDSLEASFKTIEEITNRGKAQNADSFVGSSILAGCKGDAWKTVRALYSTVDSISEGTRLEERAYHMQLLSLQVAQLRSQLVLFAPIEDVDDFWSPEDASLSTGMYV